MTSKRNGCLRFGIFAILTLIILGLGCAGLFAWDNSRLSNFSENADILSPEEKARIIEAQNLRQTVGNEVLPGWGQAEIPIIVYNEAYAFLTGITTPPSAGWMTVRANRQVGTAWELVPGDDIQGDPYYRQALSSDETPQCFTVKVGDRFAATMTTYEYSYVVMRNEIQDTLPGFLKTIFPYRIATNLLVGNTDQYITYLLHESAHAYQAWMANDRLVAGEQANFEQQEVYPWEDESLREDWETELKALQLALRADTIEETRILAREFLQTRVSRREEAGLSSELIDFERHREWVEGIGRYAELSGYRLAQAENGYLPVEEILPDADFFDYEKYDQRWTREIDQMMRMATDESERRFYYTGMAQAVLLDRLDPAWKMRLFEPGIWLEDLLAETLEMELENY